MNLHDRTYLYLSILIVFSVIVICTAQRGNSLSYDDKYDDKRIKIVWCTINYAEQRKCNNFKMANERDRLRSGYDAFRIECYQATDKDECMLLLDQEKATITSLDAGEIFIGGRYNSLVPIAQEILQGGLNYYYSVAVVKKGKIPEAQSLYDLRGKRACFAGVETFAGWVLPIYTLMTQGGMEIIDCNNHVKSAIRFFGPSCAVNSLSDKYNPIGDNSDKLCQICIGKIPGGRCTPHDPYAGYEGAFRCLLESGDIAFLKHSTIPELVSGDKYTGLSKDSFELFCKDGSRRPIDDFANCNWGKVASDAIVTSSAASFEKREKLQDFLTKAAKFYKAVNKTWTNTYNNGDNNKPFVDEFGNPYDPNQSDPNRNNQYDPNRDNRNDQYRNSRFKRQDFSRGQNYDPYSQDRNRQNPNDFNNRNPNDFNNRNPDDFNNRNPNDYYNRDRQDDDKFKPPEDNPFARDPFTINREQYGVNIDPYQDGSYDRNKDDIFINRTFAPNPDYNNTYFEVFSLFESSPRYGIDASNLLVQDGAIDIVALPESQQTYATFLGNSMDIIMGVRACQVNKMTLCVTSEMEKDKCIKMRTALKAQLLKPEMDCYKGHSQIHCMQAIRSGIADIAVLDASDVYTAGLNFDLVPFISEVYNLNEPEYYVVAVGKESDPSTELTYLRGKYTCHGGISTAAGWVYPLAFLISNGWIRPYGCNSIRAAAEYFTKSCVPGALSTEYNTGVPYDNMCDLCHGSSYRYCRRDASEDYYGHTGAFRCLVEGGGHVAFVKHTTVTENTGGKRAEWWARDNLNDDFELLCPDGTRAEINEYTKCNLGKVKANAIVTRGGYGYNETHVNAFINLFLYAQTFYGRKTSDEFSFSMFSSTPPYTDLIFQDATTQLKVIHPSQRHYALYLGPDFMRARRIVDCHAGSAQIGASTIALLLTSTMCLARYFIS